LDELSIAAGKEGAAMVVKQWLTRLWGRSILIRHQRGECMKIIEVTEQLEAIHDDLSCSSFTDVNLTGTTFSNVNLTDVKFESACLNGAILNDVTCIGMTLSNANLSGVSITDANTEGMTIDGISVADLMTAYRECGKKTA
jgi:hypothetical protein